MPPIMTAIPVTIPMIHIGFCFIRLLQYCIPDVLLKQLQQKEYALQLSRSCKGVPIVLLAATQALKNDEWQINQTLIWIQNIGSLRKLTQFHRKLNMRIHSHLWSSKCN
jgi:hypothetical protein